MLEIKFWKKKLAFKVLLLVFIAGTGFFLYAKMSSGASREFSPADDFPRGALVYTQFRDLPALLKVWDESELRKRYFESENFRQFQNRHLALKLVSRWQEFNDALGFEINASVFSSAAENQAAVAVYDIGKMEMVFIAPVSDEKFAATMFFQNQGDFESTELADKTVYYSRKVESDRGRQQQKVLFTHLKGRFVVATSESLLLRTAANINGSEQKDQLSDEPDFAALTTRITPHLATVWVNQAKLNEDWYFKRYWVMRNIAQLKTIRAGIFDFEMQDNKLIERREFLMIENKEALAQKVHPKEIARLQLLVPADAPFYRLQSTAGKPQQAVGLLRDTVLSRPPAMETTKSSWRWVKYDRFYDYGSYRDDESYYYLDSRFDKFIDDEDEAETTNNNEEINKQTADFENNLRQILAAAQTSSVATISHPLTLDAPLFMQFQKAAAFYLNAPEKLDKQALENAVLLAFANHLTVGNEKTDLIWSSQGDSKTGWRKLEFPALNREICYAVRDDVLIVANSTVFLESLLNNNAPSPANTSESFNELSVIRLDHRATAFDAPMKILFNEENKRQLLSKDTLTVTDFFTGNIASLLTAINQAKQVEIKRNEASKFLSEEIVVVIKAN